MSTSRAFRPVFGPGYRLFLDQLAPQSARGPKGPPRNLFTSRPSNPVCLSCRYSSGLNSSRQIRFSSSSSGSTPPKPPNDGTSTANGSNAAEQRDSPSPSSTSSSSSEPESQPQFQFESHPQSESEPAAGPTGPDTKPSQPLPPGSELPSAQNSRRSALNRRLSGFMDRAQTTVFAASQRINDLTGYSGIETLKTQIGGTEASLASAQAALHGARAAYKTAVTSRSATQREVTTLLARQKTWTPADFERFTALYRQDYELEAAVGARGAELEDAERRAEQLGRELGSAILARYHEEQIWSDKIRRMSTWGTWGLMGVNVLLFLIFQFGAEPWRRRRLVRGFEEKVREALDEERRLRGEVPAEAGFVGGRAEERVAADAAAPVAAADVASDAGAAAAETAAPIEAEQTSPAIDLSEPVDVVPDEPAPRMSWREAVSNRECWRLQVDRWKAFLVDLSSDRKVAITMRDVSLIALEGVAAGAAISGTVVILLVRRA
ncbi:Mdm33 family-domain-containing protein [Hypoxylon sp. FL1284]|nr:Mdm33 family-domain-containing protein [Hypoxylon sp. FL1284]